MQIDHQLIDRYLEQILDVNRTLNLTRITSAEQARVLHVEDSLSALPEMDDCPDGPYADLGTGGGFPGVPLAIATGRQTLLVDSVKKKIAALERIVANLDLSDQISGYAGRIEDLAREMPGHFSVLTARALSQLPSLLELGCPLLQAGGRLICFKAHVTDEEYNSACSLEDLLGMSLVSRRSLVLSDDATYREIIVFEKTAEPRVKLPRKTGLAQKRPLRA